MTTHTHATGAAGTDSTGRALSLFEKIAMLAGCLKQGIITDAAFIERLHELVPEQPSPATGGEPDTVTLESALAAIEHVEAHNGPGRAAEARAMLDVAGGDLDVEAERLLRAGRHLHERAKALGWTDDGEGAYEFIQRLSYEAGFADQPARRAATGTPAKSAPGEEWKIVPKKPTTEQWRAGIDAWNDAHGTPDGEDELPNVIYRAMLAAAPSPNSPVGAKEQDK